MFFTQNTFLSLRNVKCISLYRNKNSFFSFFDSYNGDLYFDRKQNFKTNFTEFLETIKNIETEDDRARCEYAEREFVRQQEVMGYLVEAMDNLKVDDKLRTYSLYKSQHFFGYGIAFHTESIPPTLRTHKLVYPFVEIESNSPAEEAGMRNGQRVVAVNDEFVNRDFRTLEEVVQAIEDSYYNRNFTDITVIDPALWTDCMEDPNYAAQLAKRRGSEISNFLGSEIEKPQDLSKSSLQSLFEEIVPEKSIPKAVNFSNPLIGATFKNYKVEKCLGTGAFASVYSCLDLNDKSIKAIKIYKTIKDKYIEDINRLNKIKSEFIIEYFTQFQQDQLYMIIFEFAENGDLEKLIKEHKKSGHIIDPSRIFHWAIQATQGLQVLHTNQIMHRDIKPANIFLSKDDKIKLGDLGIAKYFEEDEIKTEIFSTVGAPLYMSPEIINGEAYSFNTDVWSLGCVVYELLFLKPAFTGFVRKVESLDFGNSILSGLTKKMLKVDREQRPTSDKLYQQLMKLKKILEESDED